MKKNMIEQLEQPFIGLTVEALAARLRNNMSVVACGVFDDDVVLACDGFAGGGSGPARDDAIKIAPLNQDWAIGFFGNTLFLHLMAPLLWGLHQSTMNADICATVVAAGRSLWRDDLVGDSSIDYVDMVVKRRAIEICHYAPGTTVFLAGISSRGSEIYEWSTHGNMRKQQVAKSYGLVHRVAVPGGGVGSCRALCNVDMSLEGRFGHLLASFSDYTSVNENLGIIRQSTGWQFERDDC